VYIKFCFSWCSIQHPGVDGEEVHALLRLVLERREDRLLVEILDLAPDDHRVDRNCPYGHPGIADDGLPSGVEIASGR
jgi:hypothetical protein